MSASSMVRIASISDAAAIQGIYGPMVERTSISFELEPPTVEEMAHRIESTLAQIPVPGCGARGSSGGLCLRQPAQGQRSLPMVSGRDRICGS
ncbi:hypothetical protein PCPL58_p1059 (plasmid) [Pseudomonas cerasi]|nr:hypothetical protein PCPL58_p1059 [Pseudomonas cerasi]